MKKNKELNTEKQCDIQANMCSSLLKDLEKCANTYEKMYKDGVKELDTYSYVGVFRNIIDTHKKKFKNYYTNG